MKYKRLIIFVLITAAILGVLLFFLWQRWGWRAVPAYTPVEAAELAVPIMTYEAYGAKEHPRPYILEFKAGPGELLYIGATHTYDPADPQIALIQQQWG